MDKAALLALADRVESFDTGGPYDIARERERELNEAIAIAVGLPATIKVGHPVLGNERIIPSRIPAYTASLDAAMSLVPDEAFWRLGHDGDGADPAEFKADIIIPNIGESDPRGRSVACTAPLALTAASLRARASQ